jgi:hypothetical protein
MRYDDSPDSPQALVRQVANLASGLSLAIRAARRLNLPIEPGVKTGAQALVRWHALLDELATPPPPNGGA